MSMMPDLNPSIITDTNCGIRRFFRCWLDGSYHGEDRCRANVAFLKAERQSDDAILRNWVVAEFVVYLSHEYMIPSSTMSLILGRSFTKAQHQELSAELVKDALTLIEGETA